MQFLPWKQSLVVALGVAAGTTAASAQNIQNAQRSIELGRYTEARTALRPGDTPEAAYELGRLYQFRSLPDSAAFFFNKAASATPMGQVAAGRALLAKGQADAAATQFDAAVKATKSKDSKILTAIAQAYAEAEIKDITKALTYVSAAQTVNKKDEPNLLVDRGDIYLHTEQGGGQAMSSYESAIAANPSFAQAYYKKGVLSVRTRNFNEARTSLDKAVDLDPSYAPAYRELADMYYYAGQNDKALANLQKYVGLAEHSPATDAQYAAFLYLTKKYAEALVEINKVLVVEPNNLTMNRLKAYSLYETADYPGAAMAMDQYMKIAPADKIIADDYVYQARILNKAGRGKESIDIIKKAITLYPDREKDLQGDLASAYAATGDYDSSAKAYGKIAATGDLADQFRWASALSKNKQYMKADSVYGGIIAKKPEYAPGYLYRARTNVSLDPDSKKGLAKPIYEQYIALSKKEGVDPTKFRDGLIESNYYLGAYYAQQNDKAKAKEYFEEVLRIDPTNKEANDAMKIITAKAPVKTAVKKTTVAPKKK